MTNDEDNGKDPPVLETASCLIPVKSQTVQMGGTVICITERFPDKTVTFFIEFDFGLFFEGGKKYGIGIPVDEIDRFRPLVVVARPSPSIMLSASKWNNTKPIEKTCIIQSIFQISLI